MKTTRRALKRDTSNFDDYLMIGLVASVIFALFLALLLL